MTIGFIGSGNMARAIALGLARPALFSDSGSGRAATLADATGGEAVSTAEIARRCETIFLCHKPKQLSEVAQALAGFSGKVVSVLAATDLGALRAAYPKAKIVRTMPNIPVQYGEGVVAIAAESDPAAEIDQLLGELGRLERVPEAEFELATAIGGCAPAFFALFVQELCASAVERGMDEQQALRIVNETMRGTATALRENGLDTTGLMRAVASPGGLTERALESFDQSGLAATVERAVATVLGE